jgi:hypothetical protein
MTGTTVLVRRRDRAVAGELSRADKVAVARAARTGALPADRKLDDRMLALVTRRRKQNRDSLLYGPLMFGVLVVFAIIQALSGDARFWVLAALMLVLLISTVIQGRSNLAKLDRLATALMNRRSGTIGEG